MTERGDGDTGGRRRGMLTIEQLSNEANAGTIDTVLLGQNLSFGRPGKRMPWAILGAGIQYRPTANVSLFVSAEGTAMSDRSYSGAATGGARVSC